jgi:hypothetical protein
MIQLLSSFSPSWMIHTPLINKEHFICLKHNLYGVKQTAQNWHLHMQKGHFGRGFVQSKINLCLFIWKDCLIDLYTDEDCLVFANINETIADLCKRLSTKWHHF